MRLQAGGNGDFLHDLFLLLGLYGRVVEIGENTRVGKDFLDFLDIGGRRVEGVIGLGDVGEREGVAGGGAGSHLGTESAAMGAAASGGGEIELERRREGRGGE